MKTGKDSIYERQKAPKLKPKPSQISQHALWDSWSVSSIFATGSLYWSFSWEWYLTYNSCWGYFLFHIPCTLEQRGKPSFSLFPIATCKSFLTLLLSQISTVLKVSFCHSAICYPLRVIYVFFVPGSISLSSSISEIIFDVISSTMIPSINTHSDHFFWPFIYLTFQVLLIIFFHPIGAKCMVITLILLKSSKSQLVCFFFDYHLSILSVHPT